MRENVDIWKSLKLSEERYWKRPAIRLDGLILIRSIYGNPETFKVSSSFKENWINLIDVWLVTDDH